jgi:hypothetical protein
VRVSKIRPEGPWELSPGFGLVVVFLALRSEGPAEGENFWYRNGDHHGGATNRVMPAFAGESSVFLTGPSDRTR